MTAGSRHGVSELRGRPNPHPPREALNRQLRLLQCVNARLSLFAFDVAVGGSRRARLFGAIDTAVSDCGVAFDLHLGRIGAVLFGWRPPGARDAWIEQRMIERLDFALGCGPFVIFERICAIHRPSAEIASVGDVRDLLKIACPINLPRRDTA